MNRKPQPFDVVSSGTLRDSDLLESMLDTLEYYRPRKYKQLIAEGREVLDKFGDFGYLSYLLIDTPNDDTTEAELNEREQEIDSISWLLYESLWDAMDDIAPKDCSFCSHFGDGALLGFWPYEDSKLWED